MCHKLWKTLKKLLYNSKQIYIHKTCFPPIPDDGIFVPNVYISILMLHAAQILSVVESRKFVKIEMTSTFLKCVFVGLWFILLNYSCIISCISGFIFVFCCKLNIYWGKIHCIFKQKQNIRKFSWNSIWRNFLLWYQIILLIIFVFFLQ